ncbi:hypothetical protein NDU88_012153 [Pleurodeles waltl]|uniref:Uncharacterized protein n=1 Tax=Pleurodeles waltl TaxID=8319 RepID=A0AAV7R335_PLEWA|nr:hypothetical protein NDU88_012153 [Pleurodeles waltl]
MFRDARLRSFLCDSNLIKLGDWFMDGRLISSEAVIEEGRDSALHRLYVMRIGSRIGSRPRTSACRGLPGRDPAFLLSPAACPGVGAAGVGTLHLFLSPGGTGGCRGPPPVKSAWMVPGSAGRVLLTVLGKGAEVPD